MLAARLDMAFVLACPPGYELADEFQKRLAAAAPGASFRQSNDPRAAVADADVVYTDTWTSMGQVDEKARREADFAPFQVNADLLAAAPERAIVMHCLPAYRGKEVSAEAENRLHLQRSLLNVLMAEGGL